MTRQRFWSAWDRFGGLLMLGLLIAVFVLGFVGITWYDRIHSADISLGSRLYMAATLFLAENGAFDGEIPWPLEIARWAAPVVLATAAVGTVLSLVRHRAWSWGVRRLEGHVVIVGLGERGWRAARSARDAGRAVVVVEADAANPHLPSARRLGIPVVVGDAAEPARLAAAGLGRASRAIVLVGDSAATTAVAGAVAAVSESPQTTLCPEFCCYLAVDDADAARELNVLMHDQGVSFRREFFALEERAGPAIVDRWAGLLTATDPPPVVVVGSGVAACSIIATIERRRTATAGEHVPEVHWLLRERGRGVERVLGELDGGGAPVRVHTLAHADSRGDLVGVLRMLPRAPGLVVVAERDDAEALGLLAAADEALRDTGSVIVGVTAEASLVRMLRGHRRIQLFDVTEELGSDEQIARGRLEALARALHDGYLQQLNRTLAPDERAAKPAYRPWGKLPGALKSQNYEAARAARGMLRERGLDIVPRSSVLPALTTLDEHTVDALARAEHIRWFRARNPDAADPDWAAVDPVQAEQSRDQVRRLPGVLAAADLQITPLPAERA